MAPNKFLAKIASDSKKPNGLFVIQPHEIQGFLLPLPIGRIPGVGQFTEARMNGIGITTVVIYALDVATLEQHFGRYGRRLYELAEKVWVSSKQNARMARTIVLKLKTREFNTLTRSLTPTVMPASMEEFADMAVSLCERVELGPAQFFRLAGVGLSNFQIEPERNGRLFDGE